MHKKVWYAPNKFESYGEEEIKAVEECLRDGWLAGFGKRTEEFEKRTASLFGKKMGLFVNSGSSAIYLHLLHLIFQRVQKLLHPHVVLQRLSHPFYNSVSYQNFVMSN